MKYDLFLFDADDTLFDFKASEKLSLESVMKQFKIEFTSDLYTTYKAESAKLWRQLELGETTKDFLKVERFRRTLNHFNLNAPAEEMAQAYLEALPENLCLNHYAKDIVEFLNNHGDVAIVTNGIESVQKRRLEISGLKDMIKFMVVSEECGYAKPDHRFFEHTMKVAGRSSKEGVIVIGDRLETDIEGANQFGFDSCWYNPNKLERKGQEMTLEISCLSDLKKLVH